MRMKNTLETPKKQLIAVLIAISLAGCEVEANLQEAPVLQPRPIKMVTIGDESYQQVQLFPATISANQEVAISSQVPGKLKTFAVKPGDVVNQGDVLAVIDDRDYKNQLAMREADHQLAKVQFNRISNLFDKKLISQAEYDTAAAQLKVSNAALLLAQGQVQDTKIVAPFTGQVASTSVENYQYVQPQQTLLFLQDIDDVNVVIQLPASTLNRLQRKQLNLNYKPTLILNGGEYSFPVSYKQHSTQASIGTQSFEVVFSMENPPEMTLYAGMGATLSIDFNQLVTQSSSQTYFKVPVNAVGVDDKTGQHQIWLYDQASNTVSSRMVDVGEISGDSIFISGDIEATDIIAAAGLTSLKDGMLVKPIVRERGL
mgnify:CR=1 FL=1